MREEEVNAIITAQQTQVAQLRGLIGQMAGLVSSMQRRIDELEKESRMRQTVNHQQAKALGSLIRQRAGEICEKYALDEKIHGAAFRSACKKAVLAGFGISDLHDLPLALYAEARDMIAAWTSYALMRKRRGIGGGA